MLKSQHFSKTIKYFYYSKQFQQFLIGLAFTIFHFAVNSLIRQSVTSYSGIEENIIELVLLFPSIIFTIFNYILIESFDIATISFCCLLIHFDAFSILAQLSPSNELILKTGLRFIHIQNTLQMSIQIYYTMIYMILFLNKQEISLNNQQLIIILSIASIAIYAGQQYYNHIVLQKLDIYSTKMLTKLINLDNQGKLEKKLIKVKRIYFCFDCNSINQNELKCLTEAFFYNFGKCEVYSNYITRIKSSNYLGYQQINIHEKKIINILNECLYKKPFAPLVKETDLLLLQQNAQKIALAFCSTGNLIKFDVLNSQQQKKQFRFALKYLNYFDEYEAEKLSIISYYKYIQQHLINNPHYAIYDLYD
ncbi:hypothetical protein ABPG74_008095 [Tetrahymena malaccensis]